MEWTCVVCKGDNTSVACCEHCFNPKNHRLSEEITGTGWPCFRCSQINRKVSFYCQKCLTPRYYVERSFSVGDSNLENERRLILVGRTGSGKSATGNCILNKDVFESNVSNSSITQKCQRGTTCLFGKLVQLIDTPGLFDTGMDNDQVTKEILKCIGISAPGPHAFLMTIAIGRFTEEEQCTVELLRHVFGEHMDNYLILIFTRKDDLDTGKKTIEQLISAAPPYLKKLVKDCSDRYIAWNNNGNEDEKKSQIKSLFDMIEEMVGQNNGTFYQSKIFEESEEVVKLREQEIRTDYEENNRIKLTDSRREISAEYHDKIATYLERENTLIAQLNSLQDQQGEVTNDIQKELEKLSDDIEIFSNTSDEVDLEKYQILEQLKERIDEVRSNLEDVQTQQVQLYKEHERNCIEKEEEWVTVFGNIDARDQVRKEIEEGRECILIRFWSRLQKCGRKITDGFISIFKHFKKTFSDKKDSNE